jgi:hypothetical protein
MFEVCWKMYGTAEVEADSMEEAAYIASKELIQWRGETLNLEDLSVDGADVEP